MFTVLKNILLILLIVGIVFMFGNFAEPVKTMTFQMLHLPQNDVLGASSKRANEFSQKVGSDLGDQIELLGQQAMNIRLGDIITTLGRAQKIPHDIYSAGEFIKDQADKFTEQKTQ